MAVLDKSLQLQRVCNCVQGPAGDCIMLRLMLTCILVTQRIRLAASAAARRRRGTLMPPGCPLCFLPPCPRRRSRRLASSIAKDLSAWPMTLSVWEQACNSEHAIADTRSAMCICTACCRHCNLGCVHRVAPAGLHTQDALQGCYVALRFVQRPLHHLHLSLDLIQRRLDTRHSVHGLPDRGRLRTGIGGLPSCCGPAAWRHNQQWVPPGHTCCLMCIRDCKHIRVPISAWF